MWKIEILVVLAVFSSFVTCSENLIDLGCWKDTTDRAVPSVDGVLAGLHGPYKSRSGAIKKCADYAKSLGFTVFAVQDGGWCATAADAFQTFQKYGPSSACQSDGEGGPWANQVYEIGTLPETVRYKQIGCFKDTGNRAITQADGRFSTLRDTYQARQKAIEKCALVADSLGHSTFAVQNGGWCATSQEAEYTYYKYGPSTACKNDGKGGPWANAVYILEKGQSADLIDLGCWKDTKDRAVPSVDAILEEQFGPYASRADPIQKCADYAKSRGFTVFAVQAGGWCATAANAYETFQKYGPSTACHSDGEGGGWANQVYQIGTVANTVSYTPIGCYKDTQNRAIPQADGRFSTLRDTYQARSNAIEKCALVAESLGYNTFAVQNGGWCATGPRARYTYDKYGASSACKSDGKGGPWGNAVYTLDAWRSEFLHTVCERKTKTIGCRSPFVIVIDDAKYGRDDDSTCPSSSMLTTQCRAEDSLKVTKQRCDNKGTCKLDANNGVYGDPCVGTHKYLQVKYHCENPTYNHDICEGNTKTISCTNGYHIDVEWANYGRTSSSTCQSEDIYTTQCYSPFSHQYVSKFCNGRSICRLEARNGVFGDPCYGTYKYLHVKYTCKAPEKRVKVVCEGSSGSIGCWSGTQIRIHSAYYGRTDASTCSGGPIHTTSCMNTHASDWVLSQCDGKTSCSVSANNGLFGDPCKTTKKYLSIQYECV